MSLALRMGKTLQELCDSMSANELRMWLEYNRRSPISDIRGDIQNAHLVSAIFRSQGSDISLDQVMLSWDGAEEDEDPAIPGEVEAYFMAQVG